MSSRSKKFGRYFFRLFSLLEIFLLFGLSFFWLFYKGDLVPTENTWDLLAYLAPFVIAYGVGVLCRVERYRLLFRKMEWVFHLLLSTSYLCLCVLLQASNEFAPFLPFSSLFFFWIVTMGLLMVVSVIKNLDHPRLLASLRDTKELKRFLVAFAFLWVVALGFISILKYPVYFWIISSIFHSIMVFLSLNQKKSGIQSENSFVVYESLRHMFRRQVDEVQQIKKETPPRFFAREMRTIFLLVLMVVAFTQWAAQHIAMGSLEDNYYLIIGIFQSPLFYVGVAIAIISARYNVPVLGDGVGLCCMALSLFQVYFFAPLAIGYVLMTLILYGSNQPSTSYASTLVGVILAWTLGMLLFAYYGMIVDLGKMIAFFLRINLEVGYAEINLFFFAISGFFFGIYLGCFVLEKILENRNKNKKNAKVQTAIETRSPRGQNHQRKELTIKKSGVALLIIVLCGLISPVIILGASTKGPPLIYPDSAPFVLEDYCGTALAGFSNTTEEYDNLSQLGVHWVRDHFSWRDIEPVNDGWTWSRYDTLMDNATKYNISVIAMLNYPPAWVDADLRYVPPEMIPEYLEYVNETVRRYKDRVAMWEIWNEPDGQRFWDGPMEHYYLLFDQTVDLIHSIDPDLYILGGSMAAAGPGWMPPYLAEMFQRGIMEHVDGISIHFYGFDPDTLYQGIQQYIIIGERYGFTGDYLITEIGNPTGGTYPHHVFQARLAENIIKKMVISSALKIKNVIWYCTKDSGNATADPRNSEAWFGLMYNNYTWKYGAHAFSLFSRYCANSTYRPDLITKIGGISATDLMASLYRQANGTSTLIMWYAPTMYETGTVSVTLDLSAKAGTICIHDIFDGTSQLLTNNSVLVGDQSVFITFEIEDTNHIISLTVEESLLAVGIFIGIFGTLVLALSFTLLDHRQHKGYTRITKKIHDLS